jgi:Domain of unknown function (DUF4153)
MALVLAVACGALGFAVFVPLGRVGVGWVLGGLCAGVGVAVMAKRRRVGPRLSSGDRIARAGWGVSALALLSVLTFRNAWWLVTFCVLGALGCAALAVTGGRSIRAILFSLFAAPIASLRGLPWLVRSAADTRSTLAAARGTGRSGGSEAAGTSADHTEDDGTPKGPGRHVWSIVVTLALLLIFGALFASADAAFATVLDKLIPTLNGGTIVAWLFLLVVGGLTTLGGAYLVSAPPDLSTMHTAGRARFRRTEWVLPIGALVVLFAGFVAVQVTVLFGGRDHVLKTAGLTSAEYARSGFWQLITVTLLTLVVVAIAARWVRRADRTDRILVRALLGGLAALTLVVVASALSRMYAYQEAYSFTGERIFVMAFELLLGGVFLMVLIAGITLRGDWIPQAIVASLVGMQLGLAVLNPEAYAAERNVQRYQETGRIDLYYLAALSADATPALSTLPLQERRCALSKIVEKLADADPWYGWNVARDRAREVLASLGPGAIGENCRSASQYDFPKSGR